MAKQPIVLWGTIFLTLVAAVFLPIRSGIIYNFEGDIELTGIRKTLKYTRLAQSCPNFRPNEKETVAAAAIVSTEASLRSEIELLLDNKMLQYLPFLVNFLDISVGPAQLKWKHYHDQPNLSPANFCDSIVLVREMIFRNSLTTECDWSKFLQDYIGVKHMNLQSEIYRRYTTGAWYNLNFGEFAAPPW